jgi:hypothetical protein
LSKFYCASGSFKNICDAPNALAAAKKTIQKILESETDLGLLILINERGFGSKTENLISPTIPLLKLMDYPVGNDFELEQLICISLKIKRENISDKEMHWLLSGDLEDGEEQCH